MLKAIEFPDKKDWPELLKRPVFDTAQLDLLVTDLVNEVKLNGDDALRKLTMKFDNIELERFLVSETEFNAGEKIHDDLKSAINLAKTNIEKFHYSQKEEVKKIETSPGVVCWRHSVPIEKVGCMYQVELLHYSQLS